MKGFRVLFLIFMVSTLSLSAASMGDVEASGCEERLYFCANDVEVADNVISIHLDNNVVEANVIRTDGQGLYIFASDITNYAVEKEKRWKCPYCFHWWPVGQKCKNPECPTNQW